MKNNTKYIVLFLAGVIISFFVFRGFFTSDEQKPTQTRQQKIISFINVTQTKEIPIYNPDTETDELVELNDVFTATQTTGGLRDASATLYFGNAHICGFEDLEFLQTNENTYEFTTEIFDSSLCTLEIEITPESINFYDQGDICRRDFCGARGGLNGVSINR